MGSRRQRRRRVVRYFAEKLRPVAGRTTVVENKVGAASNIATEYVARSKPDGHTLYPFGAPRWRRACICSRSPSTSARRSRWRPPPAISRIHAGGRREVASIRRAGIDGGREAKGSRASYAFRPIPAASWARSTRTRRSRCARGGVPYRRRFVERDDQRQDRLRPARSIFAARAAARGRLGVLAVSTGKRPSRSPIFRPRWSRAFYGPYRAWGVMVTAGRTGDHRHHQSPVFAIVEPEETKRFPQRLQRGPDDHQPV